MSTSPRTYKIAIASWGDPSGWSFVKYCFHGDHLCKESKYTKGFSTLNLLVDVLNVDKIIIFTLDTLLGNLSLDEIRNIRDYREVIDRVRSHVDRYLCTRSRKKISINILPGRANIIKQNTNIVFRSNPLDLGLVATYKIYTESIDALEKIGNIGKLEALIDTTHGINYLALAIREASIEALTLLSIATASPQIETLVLNSDPYQLDRSRQDLREKLSRREDNPCTPKGEVDCEEIPTLYVNEIQRATIRPWHMIRYIDSYEVRNIGQIRIVNKEDLCRPRGQRESTEKNICSARDLIDRSIRIITLFRIGALPELAIEVKKNICIEDRVREVLDETYDCLINNIEIQRGDRRVEFRYRDDLRIFLREGFRILLHAHALIRGVRKILELKKPEECRDREETRDIEISDKEIEKLTRLIEGSQILKTTVNREREKINKLKTMSKLSSAWQRYEDIVSGGVSATECSRDNINKNLDICLRDFIAHAGFHTEFLDLRIERGEIMIRVNPDYEESLKKIIERFWSR